MFVWIWEGFGGRCLNDVLECFRLCFIQFGWFFGCSVRYFLKVFGGWALFR